MATLNLDEMIPIVDALKEDIRVYQEALINLKCFEDFTAEDKALLTEFSRILDQWQGVAGSFLENLTNLKKMGYPDLPFFEVPPSMLAKLEEEVREINIVKERFRAAPVVSGLGVELFGEVVPKDPA